MGVHIFTNEEKMMTEDTINDSYAMYLHKFVEDCGDSISEELPDNCAIMSYDEFKEYCILKVLGRSAEFTANIARDYQYLCFDNFIPTNTMA